MVIVNWLALELVVAITVGTFVSPLPVPNYAIGGILLRLLAA